MIRRVHNGPERQVIRYYLVIGSEKIAEIIIILMIMRGLWKSLLLRSILFIRQSNDVDNGRVFG